MLKGKRLTEEQIAFALRQVESGVPAVEICRKMGVSEKAFYASKKKYGGMGLSELRRLRQLEEQPQAKKVRLDVFAALDPRGQDTLGTGAVWWAAGSTLLSEVRPA